MTARQWSLGLALGALLVSGTLPARAADPASLSPEELSAEFAVPERQVRDLHDREGLAYGEIRTALILSRETGLSLDNIVGLRRGGVSFEDIAARHRLDLADVIASYERERSGRNAEKEPRQAVRSEPDQQRVERLAGRYGVAPSEIAQLRREGLDWARVEQTLEVARRLGRSPEEVAELRRSGMPWSEIEERFARELPAEQRPLWDSPSNPFAAERWNNQNDWRLYRSDPGFPPEQVDGERERPAR